MSGMIAWFVRNSVAANLLAVCLVVGGIIAVANVNSEVFPEISLDRINIQVSYLGAAPSGHRSRPFG